MSVSLAPVQAEPLRHGYSAQDIDRIAGKAVRWHRPSAGFDVGDCVETAWFAIVEHLYMATAVPPEAELFGAAVEGLVRLCHADNQTRGFARSEGRAGGPGRAPGFVKYWVTPSEHAPEPGFVTALTDGIALGQIFTHLSGIEREALLALAAHGDYLKAATELGISESAFHNRIASARQSALALWHEGETPRRARKDQRVERRTLPAAVTAVLTEAELPGVLLPHVEAVFTALDIDQIFGRDLITRLAEAHPGLYSGWDGRDLAKAMRACGVATHLVHVRTGPGRRDSTSGYRLTDVTAAINQTSHDQSGQGDHPDPFEAVLLTWLHAETERRPRPSTRADMVAFITAAGPTGVSTAQIDEHLPIHRNTLKIWLRAEIADGTITRITKGRYAATSHQGTAEVAA